MNKTFNYHDKVRAYILLIIPAAIVMLAVIMCSKSSDTEVKPKPLFTEQMLGIRSKVTPPTANAPMAGDTAYIPIAWGAELRVVNGIGVKKSNHKKFGDYWFSKVMAYSRVKPANYMQDSTWERVAFADSVAFGQNDTFYICRRKIY